MIFLRQILGEARRGSNIQLASMTRRWRVVFLTDSRISAVKYDSVYDGRIRRTVNGIVTGDVNGTYLFRTCRMLSTDEKTYISNATTLFLNFCIESTKKFYILQEINFNKQYSTNPRLWRPYRKLLQYENLLEIRFYMV